MMVQYRRSATAELTMSTLKQVLRRDKVKAKLMVTTHHHSTAVVSPDLQGLSSAVEPDKLPLCKLIRGF